jgi:hypothetical protein
MKRKEMIQLGIAVVILFAAGVLIYTSLAPKKSSGKSDKYTVEKVKMIDPDFDNSALQQISNNTKVRDFYTEPDLGSGLGNQQPFNSVR